MGKSLIIKGADFSANGIKVTSLKGEQVKTNIQANALNIAVKQSWLSTLGLTNGQVIIRVSSNDSVVNTKLNGKTINVLKYVSEYSYLGEFTWGNDFTFNYPIANLVELAIQTDSTLSDMDNRDIIVKILQ